MCAPVLVGVAVAATAAAGGVAAYGQYQQGKAQENMYKYQAALAYQQQKQVLAQAEQQKQLISSTAKANISAEQTAAAQDAKRLAREVSEVTGAQRAGIAKLGIGGVTAADIAFDTIDKSQLDQYAIRYNADVRSWEIGEQAKADIWSVGEEAKSSAWALSEEARQYGYAAKVTRKATKLNLVSSILNTAAQTASVGAMAIKTSKPPGTPAGAGRGGYGTGTPAGARDMGYYTKVRF